MTKYNLGNMKLSTVYSYTMRADTGFAPHFDLKCKFLSLAFCKPDIRRSAQEQDWVLGIGGAELSKNTGKDVVGRLIFAAKISETPDFDSYFTNLRFKGRVDNIYHSVDGKGSIWIQEKNPYHDENDVERDTKANRVLVSDHFLYFGSKGPKVEEIGRQYSRLLKKGPKHKRFELNQDGIARKFVKYLEKTFGFNKCSKSTEQGNEGRCGECETDLKST